MAQRSSLFKIVNPWVAGTIVVTFLSIGAVYFGISQAQSSRPTPVPSPTVAPAKAVTALGRLEPKGEVIKLSLRLARLKTEGS